MSRPRLVLERIYYGQRDDALTPTLGIVRWDDELLYTLEDRWNGNAIGDSCIPDGVYRCAPRRFNAGRYLAVGVDGVPGRTQILIHRGNVPTDVRGCIVLGTRLSTMLGQVAVADSAGAWDRFFPVWGHLEFDLVVKPLHPLRGTRDYVHQESA
jgi:hypothetical protein